MSGQALLFVMTDVDAEVEDEFNAWYDTEQLPYITRVPGFLGGARYRALEGAPRYLSLYDLADVGALEHQDYLRKLPWSAEAPPHARRLFAHCRNVVRGVYEHIITLPVPAPADLARARALLLDGLEVAPERAEEFAEWYDTEHLPALAGSPGTLRARRYRLHPQATGLLGNPLHNLALYDLESPEAQASAEWDRRRSTPWTSRMRRCYTRRVRNVYERIASA